MWLKLFVSLRRGDLEFFRVPELVSRMLGGQFLECYPCVPSKFAEQRASRRKRFLCVILRLKAILNAISLRFNIFRKKVKDETPLK